MSQLSLRSNHQPICNPLELPDYIVDLAVNGLIFALVDSSINEVEACGTALYLLSLVDIADLRLFLVLMSLKEDLGGALTVIAKSTTFLQRLLPSSEIGVDHKVITKPIEGQC